MVLKIHLYIDIANFLGVKLYLHFPVSLDVPKSSELMEMSTECIPSVIECFIASADEAPSLNHVMPLVKGRSSEVLIDGMDFEPLKGIDWSNGVLPDIAHDIVEVTSLEEIDRVG